MPHNNTFFGNDYKTHTGAKSHSEYYNSLDKKEKRKLTREKITSLFCNNPIFKNYFNEETDTYVNGEKFKAPIRINGYKKREINYD